MASALGRLVAAVALDTAEFVQGADKAKYTAAQMASDVDRTLKGLENKVKGTIGSIGTAIAGGFAISALKSQFDAYAEGAAKLQDLAAKAGTSTAKMSALIDVAKLSRTSADELSAALAKLSRGLVNQTGDTAGAGKALAFLGISANDSTGKLKDSATITEEVAAKLALMQDGAAKTAIVMDLYGKAGANVIPVLKDLAEFGVKNATITDMQAKAAKEYEQDLVRLGMAKSALVRIIASELLPVADALVKTLLNLQTQTGGVRDQAQALAQDGSIRSFAMSAVNLIGLVMNAGDGVVRVFEGIGEQIAYIVARTGAAISSVATASLAFASGDLMGAIAAVTQGAAKDADIVAAHGAALRGIFEKPLAGDALVAGVEKNLASIDAKMKQHGATVKATGDGYRQFRQSAEDSTKAIIKSIEDLIKAMDRLSQLGKDYEISLRDQVEQEKFDVEMLGKSADQVELLTAMRKMDLDLRKEVAKISSEDDSDTSAAQGEQIANMTTMNEQAKDRIALLMQTGQAIKAQQADFQAQVSVWDQIGTAAGKFFSGFVTTGKSAIQQFREDLKKLAGDLLAFFAKQFILRIIATGATGTVTGAAASAAASGATSGITGTLVSAAGSYLGSTAVGAAASGFYAGAASAASEGAIGASFVGPSAALASGAVGAGAEAYGALASALGSIPVYGWIALAVIAIAAYLGGRGGGPKTGGSFMGSFDATGALSGSVPVPGSDNGRFFTPSQGDDTLKPLVVGISNGVTSALARFGGTSPGFHFGLGFDNDPQGTAQSRVSSMVTDNSGHVLYHVQDRSMDDKDVPAALQLESSRMVLVALQNSQLPQYLANVFKNVDALTATQDTINSLLQTADALKTIFDIASSDPLKDLAQGMTDALNPFAAAIRNNETAMRSAMRAYDGSLQSTQALQQATVAYYNAQLQLLASIEQAKIAIGDMFGNTVRNFKLAGLDNQGKYNFYQSEAAALQQQALAETDPEKVKALAQRIDQDMEAAFNLLSPDQQAGAEGQSFISRAQSTDTAIENHLEDLKKTVLDPMKQTLEDLKTLIGASDAAQTAAANTQQNAANTNLTAATTPRTIVVQGSDGSQQVVSFTG